MYNKTFIYSMGFALSVVLANPLKAEDIKPDMEEGAPTDRTGAGTHNQPIYHPPVAGAPKRIEGAGSRGNSGVAENSTILTVLAPRHTGHTISEQPRLYWYISKKIEKPVTLTVTYADPLPLGASIEPILEISVEVSKEGVQVFDLSEYDVKFKTDVEYEWTVSIADETEQAFKKVPKINSVGMVKRITQSSDLEKKVNTVREKEAPIIYAQAGMWYDAISSLSNLIAKYPTDYNLQQQRISLLKEIGLTDLVKKN